METYPIVQKMLTNNMCYRLARKYKNGNPIGIMVHSNGTQGVPATSWPDRWNNLTTLKAVHAHVDATTVVQALPWNIQGWHAGGAANGTHLSVELSEPIVDSEASFTATWSRVIFLCVMWCKLYGITERGIIDHSEGHALGIASNHGDVKTDPNYNRVATKRGQGYFTRNGRTMDDFRAAVAAALRGEDNSGGDSNPGGDNSSGGGNPVPATPATVRLGDRGDAVKQAQTRLNVKGAALDVDGIFGAKTEAAVKAFQQKNSLLADGIVEARTWAALLSDASQPTQPEPLPHTILRGDVGPEVRKAQTLLNAKGATLTVDGAFGPNTDAAVRAFQKQKGLTVDGIVGPKTWTALLA